MDLTSIALDKEKGDSAATVEDMRETIMSLGKKEPPYLRERRLVKLYEPNVGQ